MVDVRQIQFYWVGWQEQLDIWQTQSVLGNKCIAEAEWVLHKTDSEWKRENRKA